MLDIFQYDFIVRAFEAGIAIAVIAPLIGMFLVVRRYSLMADTLAHVSLAGVAFGVLLGMNPIIIAILFSLGASVGVEQLRTSRKIFGESVLALFLSGSLAVAVIVLSLAQGFNANLFSYLFGSIATVTEADVWIIVSLSIVAVGAILLFYKELFFTSFDHELAEASGIPVKPLNLMVVMLAALAVALSIRIVGVLLIGALMVVPVITAMQFGKGFKVTTMLAVAFSLIAVILGILVSYYLGIASGGTIVIIALILFLVSVLFGKRAF